MHLKFRCALWVKFCFQSPQQMFGLCRWPLFDRSRRAVCASGSQVAEGKRSSGRDTL